MRIDSMQELKDRVAGLTALIPQSDPVVYLDYPVHTNVGDLLIERGAEKFLRESGYHVIDRRSALDFCRATALRVPPYATIVMHGGGNFGDLYDLHQRFRERVVDMFPSNRIVLFPQTIHFDSFSRLAECARIFEKHENLHICVRDTHSLEICRRHFANPSYLFPDTAHFLWGDFDEPLPDGDLDRPLVFVRTDKEGTAESPGDRREGALDWNNIVGPPEWIAYHALNRAHRYHCVVAARLPLHPLWRPYRDWLIAKGRRLVARHSAIATNRLHMGILGLLMGRRVALSDNSYGKLRHYYETWFRDIRDVRFVGETRPSPRPAAPHPQHVAAEFRPV